MLRFSAAIQLFVIITLCGFVVGGQSLEKSTVLHDCANLFGASIDTSEDLFEVNSLFVLQPKFDSAGKLIELSVFPKYALEEKHPEWTEPEKWPLFSPSEYKDLLTRLDTLKRKGNLIEPARIGVVTNSTAHMLDKYEHAYLISGWVADLGVRFLDLYPFHQIRGRVRKKGQLKNAFSEGSRILVGELNYFVRPADYRKVRLGQIQRLQVVGPIRGYCFAGHCNP